MVARRTALAALSIVALAAAAYTPVRDNDFILWDDEPHIVENPALQGGLGPDIVRRAFEFNHTSYWQPLTILSFAIDRAVFGLTPRMFHVENVAWHAANALLLLAFLMAATRKTGRSIAVAALFAVHPINVEAVAWAVERRNLLAGFFGLAAIVAYVHATRQGKVALHAVALVCAALSLSAKGLLLPLPLLLLIVDLWPLGRSDVPLGRLVLEKVPYVAVCAVMAGVIQASLAGFRGAQPSLAVRLANACVAPIRQLVHVVWPSGLSPFYEFPRAVAGWQVLASAVLFSALLGVGWRLRRRAPYVVFGAAWFLVALLPTLGLVQAGRWPAFADRHAYVAAIGVLVAVTWGIADLLSRVGAIAGRTQEAGITLTVGAVAALAIVTARQVPVWRDSISVSRRALETAPTAPFVHYALGTALLRTAPPDLVGGIDHLATAVRLDPGDRLARTNLGIALGNAGQPEAGIDQLTAVLRSTPRDASASAAMGKLLLDVQKPRDAVSWLANALELAPTHREAFVNLGVALNWVGRFDETIAYVTRSPAPLRQLPEARFNLGVAYASTGRPAEALGEADALRATSPELAGRLAAFVDSTRAGVRSP